MLVYTQPFLSNHTRLRRPICAQYDMEYKSYLDSCVGFILSVRKLAQSYEKKSLDDRTLL